MNRKRWSIRIKKLLFLSAKETIDYLAILLNIVDFTEKEKENLTSKVKNLMKKGPSS